LKNDQYITATGHFISLWIQVIYMNVYIIEKGKSSAFK
jgi:hypothetical protein